MYLITSVVSQGLLKKVHIGKVRHYSNNMYSILTINNENIVVGTEFQGWLLWYSLPVLDEILPNIYYEHYAHLVAGVGLLLSSEIKEDHIEQADQLLKHFCIQIAHLYGKNLHKKKLRL